MQNYKTIDKSSIKPGAYLKLSAILDSDEPHFVVAQYVESTNASQEEYFNMLQECWHFKGPMAELDAHNFYCSMLPELAEDFEYKSAESYGSHVAERHYRANYEPSNEEYEALTPTAKLAVRAVGLKG